MKIPYLSPVRGLAGFAVVVLAVAAGCNYAHGSEPAPCNDPTPATYAAVITPILAANCLRCHGATAYQTLGGGTNLGTYQGIKNVPTSLLLGCIEHQPGYDAMPKGGSQLSDCDIARIKTWITAGQLNN